MPIVSVEIMKIIDEREMQKTPKEKQRQKGASGTEAIVMNWFCCEFKLGFLQLICKASIIFKSNLELVLSIILKQRELWVKVCCGGV